MIVSASYRTDIPAFYGDWFMARLTAGVVRVRNPYGGAELSQSLKRRDVEGFVFWTRNAGPFMDALAEIDGLGFPFVVQFTITGYPRALERRVADAGRAVEQVRAIARRFGPRAGVWRYDPILDTSLTRPHWHRKNFARLAAALHGAVDEVVVSWATIYRKTARNLGAAANRHGFEWRDPGHEEKRSLLADLAAIAAEHGMRLTLCAQPELLPDAEFRCPPHPNPLPGGAREPDRSPSSPSPLRGEGRGEGEKRKGREGDSEKRREGSGLGLIHPARCIDAGRLSDIAGHPIAAKTKGNRPGCACAQSRDIGAYDSCPHGCTYCYAVSDAGRARARFRTHDPQASILR